MSRSRSRIAGVLLAGLCVWGCAGTPDRSESQTAASHVLRPGENLYRLSLYSGVPVEAIMRANRIDDATTLSVGQSIVIPNSRKQSPSHTLALRSDMAPLLRLIFKAPLFASLINSITW